MSFTSANYSLAQQQELEAVQGHQMIPLPSAILFTCLAPLTVLGNGLLLLIFTKNTVSLLRTPSNFFIFSMAFANFLTGAVLQPLLAYRYYYLYLSKGPLLMTLRKVMSAFSIVTMNVSIISVCAFSWDSFLALSQPIKHRHWMTVRRAKVLIFCTWVYQIGFASMLFTRIPLPLVLKTDLYVNTTLVASLLLLSYFFLYKAFKKRERRRACSFGNSNLQLSHFRVIRRGTSMENRMRKIIFLFTLVTTIPIIPVTVVWYVTGHCVRCQRYQPLVLTEKVLNQLVFVKFVLDPFVYAWRLERYRRALKKMLCYVQ